MRADHDPGPLEPTSSAQLAAYRADAVPELEQLRDDVWALGLGLPHGIRPRYTLSYLLRDAEGGFHIVDPGWNLDENWTRLGAALAELGATPADVRTVIATHRHPDHTGLTPRLAREGALYVLGRGELWSAGSRAGMLATLGELRGFGVPAGELLRLARRRRQRKRSGQQPRTPSASLRQALAQAEPGLLVDDGDVLPIPGFRLEVLATPGHTPGHICLSDAERGIVLTGDLVLPTRFPGIGLGFTASGGSAIADYLDSLSRLPVEHEALPGHGYRFRGLRARVRQSAEHQLRRSRETAAVLERDPEASTWRIASQLSWSAGWENLAPSQRFSALRQTAMHRDYLLSGAEIPPATDPEAH